MNLKEMKEMLQLMAEHELIELEVEKDGLKIKFKKGGSGQGLHEEYRSAKPVLVPFPGLPESAPASSIPPRPLEENSNVFTVKSPMVGTFYGSPAPDQPSYTTVGKKIKEGDVLCIVEAMKLMNEIKSEINGTVLEMLVKNGQPVEFDQPLFKIQKG
ncbi:MAG TPA: acetyl-CoA carboxylase biotin carboxyl carrier protein [bacterium]|nr:acetyl-CoA carboxylase biotin carboxyl carrier protein [bacterium]